MPEMLAPTSQIVGMGLGPKVALITDGRFPALLADCLLDTSLQRQLRAARLPLLKMVTMSLSISNSAF